MDTKKVIDLLNEAIELEYQAFIQYYYQSLMLKGFSTMAMAQMLKAEADIELGHAKALAEKVVALGGIPSAKIGPVNLAEIPKDMILSNIEREKTAIKIYRNLMSMITEDEGLTLIIQDILANEIKDLSEFEHMLE